jgi:glycosyltransferase involved in cell wall biosynthesis
LNGAGPKLGSFFALKAPHIADVLVRKECDAVLINGWHYKAAWQTILACWRLGIPVMVRGDSQLPSPRSRLRSKRLSKYPAYRCFIPRFDACLAVGARSRDYYLHYGAAPERVFLVPHAIEDNLFQHAAHRAQSRREELRRQWGLREQETVFLFAGKFIEKKRPMDFLRAIEATWHEVPNVAGLMVGDGPLRSACEQLADSHKLPVHFAGFLNQSRMVEAYAAADCLVLPSDGRETWGLVVNEAMSCSRPAIVSEAVGCAPDLVRDGRTGAVFPLGDVGALSKILLAFARDPARVRSMGERARAGLQSYSLEAAVQGVVDAVEAVTQRRWTR